MTDITKKDIAALNADIADKRRIMDEFDKDIADRYKRLEEMQANCMHDWDTEVDPIGGMCVVTCRKCGDVRCG